jgi:hypothetical protein
MEWLPPSRTNTHGNPASIAAREIILKRSTRFIAQLQMYYLTEISESEIRVDKIFNQKKANDFALYPQIQRTK